MEWLPADWPRTDWTALAAIAGWAAAVFMYLNLRREQYRNDRSDEDDRIKNMVGSTILDRIELIVKLTDSAKETMEQANATAYDVQELSLTTQARLNDQISQLELRAEESEAIIKRLELLLEQANAAQEQIADEAEMASETVDALIQEVYARLIEAEARLENADQYHANLEFNRAIARSGDETIGAIDTEILDASAELARRRAIVENLRHDYEELRRRREDRTHQLASASGKQRITGSTSATETTTDATPEPVAGDEPAVMRQDVTE